MHTAGMRLHTVVYHKYFTGNARTVLPWSEASSLALLREAWRLEGVLLQSVGQQLASLFTRSKSFVAAFVCGLKVLHGKHEFVVHCRLLLQAVCSIDTIVVLRHWSTGEYQAKQV